MSSELVYTSANSTLPQNLNVPPASAVQNLSTNCLHSFSKQQKPWMDTSPSSFSHVIFMEETNPMVKLLYKIYLESDHLLDHIPCHHLGVREVH